jgi:hypothetical protein
MNDKISLGEIILYQPDSTSTQIEVRIEEETVWLTQSQMEELFSSTKQNISLHIRNIFNEGELDEYATVKEYLTVQTEGVRRIRRKVKSYNLDVIISVGYRVKSIRGTQFRIWANRVLREYLLRGHVINQRVDRIERKLLDHDQKFDLLIKSNILPEEGIFYDGQIFDAYKFVCGIIKTATESVILIDNYIDESVLNLLSKRNKNVKAKIFTAKITPQLKLDLEKHNKQYHEIKVILFSRSHDRFLIIDEKIVYHIGASLKDLGKKWFAFSKINIDIKGIIKNLKY